MNKGWIKIYRKITENPMYFSEPFTRMQAWIDLLILANHDEKIIYVRGNKIEVMRGEIARSMDSLAQRWRWSRGKVIRYIKELEKSNMVVQQKNSVITKLSICNYDAHQSSDTTDGTTDGQQTVQQTVHKQELKNERIKEVMISREANASMSAVKRPTHKEAIDYQELIEYFNTETKGVFSAVRYPISEKRKNSIRARIREHGVEAFREMIQRAAKSNFLKGNNDRGWTATFDWLIKPSNFQKTLEGNYDNRKRSEKDKRSDANAERVSWVAQQAAEAFGS